MILFESLCASMERILALDMHIKSNMLFPTTWHSYVYNQTDNICIGLMEYSNVEVNWEPCITTLLLGHEIFIG